MKIPISPGITYDDSFGEGAFGFLYVEVLQESSKGELALEVLADLLERRQHFFDSLVNETSLQEHLMQQAEMADLSPEALQAMRHLVGALDDRGFLTQSPADVALQTGLPLAAVMVLLGVILPFTDRHSLPVPLAAFEPDTTRVPGVLIHVQAIRSMLYHGLVQPMPAPVHYLLCVLALGFFLLRTRPAKIMLLAIAIAIAIAGTVLLLWKGMRVEGATLSMLAILAFAARAGVFSAQLAQRGITSPREAIEGKFGLFSLYQEGNPLKILDGLGQRFEHENTAIKKYPCCACSHASLEAALGLIREHDLKPADVTGIEVFHSTFMHRLVGSPFNPGDNPQVSAQFSVQYAMACAPSPMPHGMVTQYAYSKPPPATMS